MISLFRAVVVFILFLFAISSRAENPTVPVPGERSGSGGDVIKKGDQFANPADDRVKGGKQPERLRFNDQLVQNMMWIRWAIGDLEREPSEKQDFKLASKTYSIPKKSFFALEVFPNWVDYFLVDELPKDCHYVDASRVKLGADEKLVHVGCTSNSRTLLLKEYVTKMMATLENKTQQEENYLSLARILVHERLWAYQRGIDHREVAVITDTARLLLTKIYYAKRAAVESVKNAREGKPAAAIASVLTDEEVETLNEFPKVVAKIKLDHAYHPELAPVYTKHGGSYIGSTIGKDAIVSAGSVVKNSTIEGDVKILVTNLTNSRVSGKEIVFRESEVEKATIDGEKLLFDLAKVNDVVVSKSSQLKISDSSVSSGTIRGSEISISKAKLFAMAIDATKFSFDVGELSGKFKGSDFRITKSSGRVIAENVSNLTINGSAFRSEMAIVGNEMTIDDVYIDRANSGMFKGEKTKLSNFSISGTHGLIERPGATFADGRYHEQIGGGTYYAPYLRNSLYGVIVGDPWHRGGANIHRVDSKNYPRDVGFCIDGWTGSRKDSVPAPGNGRWYGMNTSVEDYIYGRVLSKQSSAAVGAECRKVLCENRLGLCNDNLSACIENWNGSDIFAHVRGHWGNEVAIAKDAVLDSTGWRLECGRILDAPYRELIAYAQYITKQGDRRSNYPIPATREVRFQRPSTVPHATTCERQKDSKRFPVALNGKAMLHRYDFDYSDYSDYCVIALNTQQNGLLCIGSALFRVSDGEMLTKEGMGKNWCEHGINYAASPARACLLTGEYKMQMIDVATKRWLGEAQLARPGDVEELKDYTFRDRVYLEMFTRCRAEIAKQEKEIRLPNWDDVIRALKVD